MIRYVLAALLPATGLVLAAAHASAQPPLAFESQVFVEQVRTDMNGRASRTLTTPGQIGSGDRLVFILRYRNAGQTPINGYAVTNAIPASLRIEAGQSGAMLVSVDGGKNWGHLGALNVPTPLGGVRRATAEDVTHIRWPIAGAIPPGQSGQISYRATVR